MSSQSPSHHSTEEENSPPSILLLSDIDRNHHNVILVRTLHFWRWSDVVKTQATKTKINSASRLPDETKQKEEQVEETKDSGRQDGELLVWKNLTRLFRSSFVDVMMKHYPCLVGWIDLEQPDRIFYPLVGTASQRERAEALITSAVVEVKSQETSEGGIREVDIRNGNLSHWPKSLLKEIRPPDPEAFTGKEPLCQVKVTKLVTKKGEKTTATTEKQERIETVGDSWLIVSVMINHRVADAFSTVHFLIHWGHVMRLRSRQQSEEEEEEFEMEVVNHNRVALNNTSNTMEDTCNALEKLMLEESKEKIRKEQMKSKFVEEKKRGDDNKETNESSSPSSLLNEERLQQWRFRFSNAVVQKYQEKLLIVANGGSGVDESFSFSKNTLICSNFWQCVVRANKRAKADQLKAEEATKTTEKKKEKDEGVVGDEEGLKSQAHLFMPCNVRGRTNLVPPGLLNNNTRSQETEKREFFFGNCLVGILISYPNVDALLDAPLFEVAVKVHKGVKEVITNEAIINSKIKDFGKLLTQASQSKDPIMFSNWVHAGLYDVNFFECRPFFATSEQLPPCSFLGFMNPSPPPEGDGEGVCIISDGVDIPFSMTQSVFQYLVDDVQFIGTYVGKSAS